MIIALVILLLLAGLYLLSVRGRSGHPLMRQLRKWKYAHRGLHGNGVPENSMAAFRLALENGYGIELDLHLLADGNVAVIHDRSLNRTAGADVRIDDLTTEDLENFCLEGTQEKIPTFRQVLELFDGKAPLIVEVKSDDSNHNALMEKTCEILKDYKGLYCFESFDPRCIWWLKRNRPEIVRGQLSHNSLKNSKGKAPFLLRFTLTNMLYNLVAVPDFVAYQFSDRDVLPVRLARKLWKVQGVAWTLKTQEECDIAAQENWIPIFEGFRP